MTMSNPRALPLWLAAAFFAAQLVLAWHAPSHINTDQASPHQGLLASADCQVCTHGQGLLVLPVYFTPPAVSQTAPASRSTLTPLLRTSERLFLPPRGPPASI